VRAFRFILPLLAAIGPLSPSPLPALAQTIPNGYQLRTDPGGTAMLLVVQRYENSATDAVARGLAEVAVGFDGRPIPLGGFRDAQDQRAEVGFRATLRRVPVSGIGFATLVGGVATIGFAFDGLQAAPASMVRLLQQVGYIGTGAEALNWRVAQYPDGSGQMQLPDGWQITGAFKGMVEATGPHGSVALRFHLPEVYTRATVAQMQSMGIPTLAVQFMADPTDPVSAMVALEPQIDAHVRKFGGSGWPRTLRVVEVAPIPVSHPLAQAGLIDHEAQGGGIRGRCLSYVILSAVFSMGAWGYQHSFACSPVQSFAQNLPVLLQIWGSAQTAGHVIQEYWDNALNNLREAGEIRRQAQLGHSQTMARVHADRIEVIRGSRLVEDTATGQRVDANLAYVRDIVQGLNTREGWNRYREIPARDLVR
jgi:hypothetical protein